MLISHIVLWFVTMPHWIINLVWSFIVKDAEESKSWKLSTWCAWAEMFVVVVLVILEQNKWLLA